MNPIVVIACWGRLPLLEINLRLLSYQNVKVVVVTSTDEDFAALHKSTATAIKTANNPLGRKWQAGVEKARELGADPLIILGSDDFLSNNFISKACDLAKYHDFVFFDEWYIHAPKEQKNYFLKYNMMLYDKPPLGSGRVFSKRFLERHEWKIFDSERDWHLDNFIWETKHYEDRLHWNPDGMNILAVKGPWEAMNSLDKILSTPTIDWSYALDIDRQFNFTKPVKEIFKNL